MEKNATHANRMARLLEEEIKSIEGVEITQPVDANGVFAIIPGELIPELQKEFFFYTWDEQRNEVRWMTSFDTTENDIHTFGNLLRQKMKK